MASLSDIPWGAVAAALVFIVFASAVLVFRLRRAGLAVHRQLDAIRDQIGAHHADVTAGFATQRGEIDRLEDGQTRLRDQIAEIRDRVQDANAGIMQLQQQTQQLAAQSDTALAAVSRDTSDLAAFILRRPALQLPFSATGFEAKSDAELAALAESIAILRPLVPFPRWRFDADTHNPDLSYQLRRWFWQYFNSRKSEPPIIIPWHGGTRLRLFLGNDISSQIYIGGCWEPNEFAFLDRILEPGMTFFDAGANEGVYTVFAAARVGATGSVWAFEPSRRELDRLRFNLTLNGLQARVFPVALAETEGRAELLLGGYQHEPHNTLGAFAYDIESAGRDLVEVRRLDDLVAAEPPARIDVFKLDVEGAEMRILLGAARTLERYRPILLFEVSEKSLRSQSSSPQELLTLLQSHGYAIYTFDRFTGAPVPAADDQFADNMIASPAERPLPAMASWPLPRS